MSIYKYFFPWLFLVAVLLLVSACGSSSLAPNSSPGKLKVVAAENFYGDIARQLGGEHITVTSILADPQVDPHTYQSNVQTGLAVSQANLVIANGGGYDDWMDQILSGSPNSSRLLLKAFDIAPYHLP
ncbi:MAG TPA: zinc ABC transporter substrate-binding protein, partial [Ktedonobacteraceae bacterium]|nr:zinc ABC transporter substrate-binding protein [Ktedonobacteraceae bacterium]